MVVTATVYSAPVAKPANVAVLSEVLFTLFRATGPVFSSTVYDVTSLADVSHVTISELVVLVGAAMFLILSGPETFQKYSETVSNYENDNVSYELPYQCHPIYIYITLYIHCISHIYIYIYIY